MTLSEKLEKLENQLNELTEKFDIVTEWLLDNTDKRTKKEIKEALKFVDNVAWEKRMGEDM